MSIQSEITRIQNKRDLSLAAVANKGVTVPASSTIDDLPGLIDLIDQGSGDASSGTIYQDLDGYLHLSEDAANILSIVDTLDTAGGTIRTITGTVDIGKKYSLEEICAVGFTAMTEENVVLAGTHLRAGLFYRNTSIKTFVGENVTYIAGDNYGNVANSYAFAGCTNLISVSLPKINDLYHVDNIFQGCTKLATVDMDYKNMTRTGTSVFMNCPALMKETYVFPKLTGNIYSNFLTNNTHVTAFDIGSSGAGYNSNLYGSAFTNDSSLSTLVIRFTTRIYNLSHINAFTGTPFASGRAGGTLYVPQALVDQYTQATNWSTILGYENNKILPIEGSIYETQYADGTPIESE